MMFKSEWFKTTKVNVFYLKIQVFFLNGKVIKIVKETKIVCRYTQ